MATCCCVAEELGQLAKVQGCGKNGGAAARAGAASRLALLSGHRLTQHTQLLLLLPG